MKLSNIDVKRQNRVNTYRVLLRQDSIAKQELSVMLGMSLPTITKNLKELSYLGLAGEVGVQVSTGGRKAVIVAPYTNARMSIGVDITQNHISLAAVNLKGDVKTHIRLPLKFSNSLKYYSIVSQKIHQFVQNCGITQEVLLGIGISVPGIVSSDGSVLLDSHLLNLSQTSIYFDKSQPPVPYRLFNDAYAACLAERWEAGGRESFIFLSLSNSVGGALVVHDRILHGNNQRSGELGHMCFMPDGKTCYCGKAGHYDTYGSALVLAKPAGGRLEDFFKQMEEGNTLFKDIFEEYLDNLALMIINLRMLADYDVTLGGYVGNFLAPYLNRLKAKVAALDTFQDNAEYVHLCYHRFEASAVGAALYYIDDFISNV